MSQKEPIEHGTRTGYLKEITSGLETCEPCRAAHDQYAREYRLVKCQEEGYALLAKVPLPNKRMLHIMWRHADNTRKLITI